MESVKKGCFFLLIFTVPTSGDETCPSGQYKYGDCECLEFVITPQVVWDDANRKCVSNGGSLVTIYDENKQNFIADTLTKISEKNGVWIGLRRDDNKEKEFRWVDGTPLSGGYTAWAPTEPDRSLNQQCGLLHVNTGWKWKDFFCGFEVYSYICQYELECNAGEASGTGKLSLNEVIVISAVGGVVGLICFFAIVFMLINFCRDAISRKRHGVPPVELREVETGHNCEEVLAAEPMIPEAVTRNDLDRASMKRRKPPLVAANVRASITTDSPSITGQETRRNSSKIVQPESSVKGDQQRRNSRGSIEDNYLAANTNMDEPKVFSSSTRGIDKS
ncbi:uncharacterized protein [Watersipora subatra]|uniref:uncharacterized protein n=1 Tax=Watersipora subatra TaxID=2589382 RepID=UPI00355C1A33